MKAGEFRFLALLAGALLLTGLQVRRDLLLERMGTGLGPAGAPGTPRPQRERETHARSRKVDREALRKLLQRGELSEREAVYWEAEP